MTNEATNAKTIFGKALEFESPEARRAFLNGACGDNRELRGEVDELLQAIDQAGSFMAHPAMETPTIDADSAGESTGKMGCPYKLLQKLGEGGMGEVYMAEQTEPVERRVAVKIIKAGMDTRQVIGRFEAERQALAIMDHPNIAKVFDAGTTETGRPYFVMELVKGVPITEYCDEHRLDPRQRLELFKDVCLAVQHAHQKGIIHRDIKPSNVLVAEYDDRAVPKVIDFGVAKATQQRLTEKTMFTEVGTVVGTIEYMSPEQAKLNQLDIDTRSDVYSLGVLLYELLTGEPPFDRKKLRSAALDEMLRIIREEEPSRPSIKLSTSESLPSIAASRQVEPKKLGTLLRGELDWIVMKALEKDRTRRYDTANAFADDIENYLGDEPVAACPPSAGYRFRKLVRRNKAAVITSASIAATLLLGIVGTTWQASSAMRAERRATSQRDRAIEAEKEASAEAARADREAERAKTEANISRTINDFLNEDLLAQADSETQPDREIKLMTLIDRAAGKVDERFSEQPLVEAAIRDTLARCYSSLGEYQQAELHSRRAYEIRRSNLGSENPDTRESMYKLAVAISPHRSRGDASLRKAQEAEKLLTELLKIQKRILGPEDPETLRSMGQVAEQLGWQGRHKECENMLRRLLGTYRRVSGPDHQNTLVNTRRLAWLVLKQGRQAEAETLFRDALDRSQHSLGRSDSLTLSLMNDLSIVLGKQKKFREAEKITREALELLPPDDPQAILMTGNLAVHAIRQGRHAEAEKIYRDVLDIQQRVLGPTHQYTLNTQTVLAECLMKMQKQFAESERLLREVLDIKKRTLGAEHPSTVLSTCILKNSLAGQGRFTELEMLLRESVQLFRKATESAENTTGADVPGEEESRRTLAGLCTDEAWRLATDSDLEQRDPPKAVELAREATELDSDTANNWSNLGVALYRNGQYEEAAESLSKADEMVTGGDRVHQMFYVVTLWQLDRVDEAKSKYAQGAAWIDAHRADSEWHQRCREEAEQLMGLNASGREQLIADFFAGKLDSRPTALDWIDRASWQRNRGLRKESVASLTEAIELDPESSRAFNDRAWDYNKLGEFEKGITDCDRSIEIDPNNYFAFQRRAWAHQRIGKLDRAAEDAKRAIKIDPTKKFAKNNLKGVAGDYAKANRWEQAIDCIDALIEVEPENVSFFSMRATCELMLQGREQYRKRCQEALERLATSELGAEDKRSVAAMCVLVDGAVEDTAAIVKLVQEVVAAEPPDAVWSNRVLAKALLRHGQADEALPLLLEAETDNNDKFRGDTLFTLAMVYHTLGQGDVAMDYLKRADAWLSDYLNGDIQSWPPPLTAQWLQQEAHNLLGVPVPNESESPQAETNSGHLTLGPK